MKTDIELFDRYIDGALTAQEKESFEERLRSDRSFAMDFRLYLFTLNGIYREEEQDNMDFGNAMKHISKEDLMRIIRRRKRPAALRTRAIRKGGWWGASVAAVVVIGMFSVFYTHRAGMNRVDDIIVAYNYIPDSGRGPESLTADDIPSLEQAYGNSPSDDVQMQQEAGMRLAMAYLKQHNRKKARETLTELSRRYADDEEFAARCKEILKQLD